MAIEIEIVCDDVRAALIKRLADLAAEDWRVNEQEAEMMLSALKSPGLPPAAVAEFDRMVQNLRQLRDAADQQFRRVRFTNQLMSWGAGFFAVLYGASYAASGRLTDLLCAAVWSTIVVMHFWTRHRYEQPPRKETK